MAIATYAQLRGAISNWAKRSDIAGEIDDFIYLAEQDMWERLRIRDMEALATDTASLASRYVALPADYLELRKVRIYTGSQNYPLTYRTPESLTVISGSGIPSEYTITTQLEFHRLPASAYTVEYQYVKSLTGVSSANSTNAVLTRFPQIYLYGALMHFGNWNLDDKFVAKYASLFIDAIEAANKRDRKGRYGPAKSMKIEGPTP